MTPQQEVDNLKAQIALMIDKAFIYGKMEGNKEAFEASRKLNEASVHSFNEVLQEHYDKNA